MPGSTSNGDHAGVDTGNLPEWNPAAYGDACAAFYDQIYGSVPRALIDTLCGLAGAGRALELGSATGRVAMALRVAGMKHYVGVEVSAAMIAAMRAKPACQDIEIIHGEFSECRLPGPFQLIFALVSTFQLLPSAARQALAFAHLARCLGPGGTLLLECFDPLDAATEEDRQPTTYQIQTAAGLRDYPVAKLNSTRSELDAMAAAAGLGLVERWSDWRRTAHAGEPRHISLYGIFDQATGSTST